VEGNGRLATRCWQRQSVRRFVGGRRGFRRGPSKAEKFPQSARREGSLPCPLRQSRTAIPRMFALSDRGAPLREAAAWPPVDGKPRRGMAACSHDRADRPGPPTSPWKHRGPDVRAASNRHAYREVPFASTPSTNPKPARYRTALPYIGRMNIMPWSPRTPSSRKSTCQARVTGKQSPSQTTW